MADIKFIKLNSVDKIFEPTYNDIEFLPNNDIAQVYDSDYVVQAVGKVLKTDKNSTVPFPNYGTNLNQIRKTVVGNALLESQVASDVVSAISYIRTLEESPSESEQIAGITGMTATTVDLDKFTKAVSVDLTVLSKEGKTVKVTV